jgi:CHC2 zinc finger
MGALPSTPDQTRTPNTQGVILMVLENRSLRTDRVARPERRRVSTRRIIEEAKANVSTLDLAQRLCGSLRPVSARHVGRCALPGHEDRSPSSTVYEVTNSWWCFGCLRGGDVVDFAAAAWGYKQHEVKMAAADLLREFGHDIPEHPPAWFARQKRQQPVRDAIEEAWIEHYARMIFRRMFVPVLQEIEGDTERLEEVDLMWEVV